MYPPTDVAAAEPGRRVRPSDAVRAGKVGAAASTAEASSFVDASVVLGVRQPQSFSARLVARSAGGEAEISAFADIAMREVDDQRAVVLRCLASVLTLSLVTVLDPGSVIESSSDVPLPTLVWELRAGSGDATARADVLEFLRVLHEGAELRVFNSEEATVVGVLEAPGAPLDDDLARDLAFLTDVATLEEWSGMVLPIPREVEAKQVATIVQAAAWVRKREVPVTFTGAVAATMPRDVDGVDEITLEQEFGANVFGYDVPLGTGRVRLDVAIGEIEAIDGHDDLVRVALEVASPAEVVFVLTPPEGWMPSKRTARPDERRPEPPGAPWSAAWLEGERAASSELRNGNGIRFVDENAFFAWLETPDAAA